MPATAPQRRKRPHPARSARRLAGWLSVVAMAGLTGGMVTASRSATTGTSATRSTVTSVSTTASSDDGSTSAAQFLERGGAGRHRVVATGDGEPCQLSAASARWAATRTSSSSGLSGSPTAPRPASPSSSGDGAGSTSAARSARSTVMRARPSSFRPTRSSSSSARSTPGA